MLFGPLEPDLEVVRWAEVALVLEAGLVVVERFDAFDVGPDEAGTFAFQFGKEGEQRRGVVVDGEDFHPAVFQVPDKSADVVLVGGAFDVEAVADALDVA